MSDAVRSNSFVKIVISDSRTKADAGLKKFTIQRRLRDFKNFASHLVLLKYYFEIEGRMVPVVLVQHLYAGNAHFKRTQMPLVTFLSSQHRRPVCCLPSVTYIFISFLLYSKVVSLQIFLFSSYFTHDVFASEEFTANLIIFTKTDNCFSHFKFLLSV
jgi:hypothetical protein